MKKIVVILALTIASVSLFAQAPQFKGVSIEGSVNDFVTKLKTKGCSFVERTKAPDTGGEVVRMKGSYAGYQNCDIILFTDDKNKNIEGVRVIMPLKCYRYGETIEGISDNYKDVRSMYLDVKSKMTEKYGTPVVINENEINTYQGGEIRKIANMDIYGCGWTDAGLNLITIEINAFESDYDYFASVRVDITNRSSAVKSRENVLDDM